MKKTVGKRTEECERVSGDRLLGKRTEECERVSEDRLLGKRTEECERVSEIDCWVNEQRSVRE